MPVSGCDQLESERLRRACPLVRMIRWKANRQDGGLTCVQRNVRYCVVNGGKDDGFRPSVERARSHLRRADAGGPRDRNDRAFFEGVVWILRTGAPWRDVPPTFGKWNTLYQRFRRWAKAERWERMRQVVLPPVEADALLLLDSTIIKAHPHAAGARKVGGEARDRALGRSRGGFTTKLHAVVSSNGQLVRYILTGGQVNDVTQAEALITGLRGKAVVADRAYDSDAFLAAVTGSGMRAVVPSRATRRSLRELDSEAYGRRNVIERWFGRAKQYRRVATRYDKTATSYASFAATAALCTRLSGWAA
jgi:transposase